MMLIIVLAEGGWKATEIHPFSEGHSSSPRMQRLRNFLRDIGVIGVASSPTPAVPFAMITGNRGTAIEIFKANLVPLKFCALQAAAGSATTVEATVFVGGRGRCVVVTTDLMSRIVDGDGNLLRCSGNAEMVAFLSNSPQLINQRSAPYAMPIPHDAGRYAEIWTYEISNSENRVDKGPIQVLRDDILPGAYPLIDRHGGTEWSVDCLQNDAKYLSADTQLTTVRGKWPAYFSASEIPANHLNDYFYSKPAGWGGLTIGQFATFFPEQHNIGPLMSGAIEADERLRRGCMSLHPDRRVEAAAWYVDGCTLQVGMGVTLESSGRGGFRHLHSVCAEMGWKSVSGIITKMARDSATVLELRLLVRSDQFPRETLVLHPCEVLVTGTIVTKLSWERWKVTETFRMVPAAFKNQAVKDGLTYKVCVGCAEWSPEDTRGVGLFADVPDPVWRLYGVCPPSTPELYACVQSEGRLAGAAAIHQAFLLLKHALESFHGSMCSDLAGPTSGASLNTTVLTGAEPFVIMAAAFKGVYSPSLYLRYHDGTMYLEIPSFHLMEDLLPSDVELVASGDALAIDPVQTARIRNRAAVGGWVELTPPAMFKLQIKPVPAMTYTVSGWEHLNGITNIPMAGTLGARNRRAELYGKPAKALRSSITMWPVCCGCYPRVCACTP